MQQNSETSKKCEDEAEEAYNYERNDETEGVNERERED